MPLPNVLLFLAALFLITESSLILLPTSCAAKTVTCPQIALKAYHKIFCHPLRTSPLSQAETLSNPSPKTSWNELFLSAETSTRKDRHAYRNMLYDERTQAQSDARFLELSTAELFNLYDKIEYLSKGRYGRVFKAIRKIDGVVVAIKEQFVRPVDCQLIDHVAPQFPKELEALVRTDWLSVANSAYFPKVHGVYLSQDSLSPDREAYDVPIVWGAIEMEFIDYTLGDFIKTEEVPSSLLLELIFGEYSSAKYANLCPIDRHLGNFGVQTVAYTRVYQVGPDLYIISDPSMLKRIDLGSWKQCDVEIANPFYSDPSKTSPAPFMKFIASLRRVVPDFDPKDIFASLCRNPDPLNEKSLAKLIRTEFAEFHISKVGKPKGPSKLFKIM